MQDRTGRIVVYCRLGTLGSVNSLLCGVKRCENDYQPFSLSFQIRTVAPEGCYRFKSKALQLQEKEKGHHTGVLYLLEVQAGFEPADNGVADRGLTTWLLHQIFDCFNIIAELSSFVKGFFILFYAFLKEKLHFCYFTIVKSFFVCYNIPIKG